MVTLATCWLVARSPVTSVRSTILVVSYSGELKPIYVGQQFQISNISLVNVINILKLQLHGT